MHISVSMACAFALFANALPQGNAITPSFTTEIVTKTSTSTNSATGIPVSKVEDCFYLASTTKSESGWLYVGKTSGGFRYVVRDDQTTQFGLSEDGKLFVKTLKAQPIGYTSTIYQGLPSPDVDYLSFTTFENDTLVCHIEGNRLLCESTHKNQSRGYLVYSDEKRRFGFTSGGLPTADLVAAAWTVQACNEST